MLPAHNGRRLDKRRNASHPDNPGHHAGTNLKVDDAAILWSRQCGVIQIVERLLKLRFDVGDRGVNAIDFGFVLETSAIEFRLLSRPWSLALH